MTPISTGNIITTTCTGDKTITSGQSVHSNSFTIPTSSVVSRGQNIRTTSGATNSGYITSSYNSAPLNIGCLKIKTENDFVQPQSSGLPINTSSYSRAVIHSSLISNQPVSYLIKSYVILGDQSELKNKIENAVHITISDSKYDDASSFKSFLCKNNEYLP